MRRLLASPYVKGFLGALTLVSMLSSILFAYHLYTDHTALHVLIDYLNQHAAQINKLP